MTIKQNEHATEILELYYMALRNEIFWKKQSNSFWSNEYAPAKERYLYKADISRMAATRIYTSYSKYILKHL
jgi:hypothetical protein